MEQEKPKYKTFILDDVKYKTTHSAKFEKCVGYERPNPNILKSVLPGKILKVFIKEGDEVNRGTRLCVLEAMKTENIIKSTVYGTVKKLYVSKNSTVKKREILMEFEPYPEEAGEIE